MYSEGLWLTVLLVSHSSFISPSIFPTLLEQLALSRLPFQVQIQVLNCSCQVVFTGIPRFIVLHRCCLFFFFFLNKLKESPSTRKKIMTHFIWILTLLQWSGTEPQYLRDVSISGFPVMTLSSEVYFPQCSLP